MGIINTIIDYFRPSGGTNTVTFPAYTGTALVHKLTTVNDIAYTFLSTDHTVAYTAISAARTVTLPAASTMTDRVIVIKDASGSVTRANTITVDGSGSETIDGNLTLVMSAPYCSVTLYCNGSNWFVLATTIVGYMIQGGTVTQITSKATGVTLSKLCGTITMHNAALAAATAVTFTVTNTMMQATDVVVTQHDSGGTLGAYTITTQSAAGSFNVTIRNNTAGSLSEAVVIRFAIIKAVIA